MSSNDLAETSRFQNADTGCHKISAAAAHDLEEYANLGENIEPVDPRQRIGLIVTHTRQIAEDDECCKQGLIDTITREDRDHCSTKNLGSQ